MIKLPLKCVFANDISPCHIHAQTFSSHTHVSPFLAGVRSEMDSRRKSFVLSSPILRAILTFLFENGKAYPNVITQDKFLISHFLFRDHYFTGVSWSPKSDRVAVNWMNRGQNISIVSECKDPIWICTEVRNARPARFPDLPDHKRTKKYFPLPEISRGRPQKWLVHALRAHALLARWRLVPHPVSDPGRG